MSRKILIQKARNQLVCTKQCFIIQQQNQDDHPDHHGKTFHDRIVHFARLHDSDFDLHITQPDAIDLLPMGSIAGSDIADATTGAALHTQDALSHFPDAIVDWHATNSVLQLPCTDFANEQRDVPLSYTAVATAANSSVIDTNALGSINEPISALRLKV